MKKTNGVKPEFVEKIILAQLSISLAFGIYGCDSEKMTVEKKQKVENESTEIQQESEGEKNENDNNRDGKIFESVLPEKAYKEIGNHNPVMTQRFGADPYAMVYDGRVYLYMTCDEPMLDENGEILENDYSNIYKINVISSARSGKLDRSWKCLCSFEKMGQQLGEIIPGHRQQPVRN